MGGLNGETAARRSSRSQPLLYTESPFRFTSLPGLVIFERYSQAMEV
jgi:hypothetical protein